MVVVVFVVVDAVVDAVGIVTGAVAAVVVTVILLFSIYPKQVIYHLIQFNKTPTVKLWELYRYITNEVTISQTISPHNKHISLLSEPCSMLSYAISITDPEIRCPSDDPGENEADTPG